MGDWVACVVGSQLGAREEGGGTHEVDPQASQQLLGIHLPPLPLSLQLEQAPFRPRRPLFELVNPELEPVLDIDDRVLHSARRARRAFVQLRTLLLLLAPALAPPQMSELDLPQTDAVRHS